MVVDAKYWNCWDKLVCFDFKDQVTYCNVKLNAYSIKEEFINGYQMSH